MSIFVFWYLWDSTYSDDDTLIWVHIVCLTMNQDQSLWWSLDRYSMNVSHIGRVQTERLWTIWLYKAFRWGCKPPIFFFQNMNIHLKMPKNRLLMRIFTFFIKCLYINGLFFHRNCQYEPFWLKKGLFFKSCQK